MKQYIELLYRVRHSGDLREDRTGVGTKSIFGYQMRFNLQQGFPLLTLKKTNFNSVKAELLWFLEGDTNIKWLNEQKCNIWNEWATEHGDLGPIYGKQWRSWEGANGQTIDQIAGVIKSLRRDPYGRRHIVSAWNPDVLPASGVKPHEQPEKGLMALAPCHTLFQFYVSPMTDVEKLNWCIRQAGLDRLCTIRAMTGSELRGQLADFVEHFQIKPPELKLSCQLYQRSADIFLGVPFNIASYALLTHMIAQVCGYGVGDFIHTLGDAHIYTNHDKQVSELLDRDDEFDLPTLWLDPACTEIDDFAMDSINVKGYQSHPFIKAPVAV